MHRMRNQSLLLAITVAIATSDSHSRLMTISSTSIALDTEYWNDQNKFLIDSIAKIGNCHACAR